MEVHKPVEALHRRSDPETSRAAAESVHGKLKDLQQQVFDAFAIAGSEGLTDLDLNEVLGSELSTFRTRRSELVEKGLLGWTGRKVTQGGRSRRVWALIEHCPAHLVDARRTPRQHKKDALMSLIEDFVRDEHIRGKEDLMALQGMTIRRLLFNACQTVGFHKERAHGSED